MIMMSTGDNDNNENDDDHNDNYCNHHKSTITHPLEVTVAWPVTNCIMMMFTTPKAWPVSIIHSNDNHDDNDGDDHNDNYCNHHKSIHWK